MPAARSSALAQPHRYRDSVPWRVSPKGVVVNGKLERTPGPPNTVTHVWETYHAAINAAASKYQVPAQLIVATICTETGGNAKAIRHEPGYKSDALTPNLVSPGIMQTLISTARSALRNPKIDGKWLLNPANSIMAGTCVIKQGSSVTHFDPPLVAAAYNAGSVIHQSGPANRWKLRQFPIGTSAHVDRFVKWFNDACAVLASHAVKPTVGLEVIIGDAARAPAPAPKKKVIPGKKVAPIVAKAKPQPAKPAPAAISFGANAKAAAMTPYSKRVLQDIMRKAGVPFALISSTQRSPEEQARAMFANLEALGVKSQKALYGPNGDLVIDVYVHGKAAGKTAAQIQKDMTKRIIGLGPSNVSHHAADPKVLNVFDVAPSSIPAAKWAAFEKAVLADKRVHKFFKPNDGDPGFHIEIPQPLR
jgi:hypothetical protein